MILPRTLRGLMSPLLLRFVAVGMLNTAFSYALYAALVLLDIDYRLALTICTVVTIVWNFQTTGRLVFGNRRQSLLVKFVGGYALIYLLNLGLLVLFARLGVGELARQALALPAIVACSFVLNRRWVFREPESPPGPRAARVRNGV